MPPITPLPSPSPEQVQAAWGRAFDAPDDGRQLGTLLDGLTLIAAGRVRDGSGSALTVEQVTKGAADHAPAAGWQVGHRPFLAELARRVLALGRLRQSCPEEDPLLCPRRARIDPACADAPLALARAVTAVELQHAGLLAEVVTRHLRATGAKPVLPWLGVLLADEAAQCLLVTALATGQPGRDGDDAKDLFRRLVAQYAACRDRAEGPPPEWPAGPLAAACALGLLLSRPRELTALTEFRRQVERWTGWHDERHWPTRPPGDDLADLQARLTDRAALALGLGQRKPWPRAALAARVGDCWPPLLAYGFSSPVPPPRGEHDEPHP